MRHRPLHVVAGETEVELAVFSYCEILYELVRLEALVP